jgi:hypothetical protein
MLWEWPWGGLLVLVIAGCEYEVVCCTDVMEEDPVSCWDSRSVPTPYAATPAAPAAIAFKDEGLLGFDGFEGFGGLEEEGVDCGWACDSNPSTSAE